MKKEVEGDILCCLGLEYRAFGVGVTFVLV